jgi:tol-pal system protein YbgF
MKHACTIVLALCLVACSSSRSKDDLPSTIPPPQPVSQSTDARLAELQTSMTELLERLDVLNARIAKLESGAPPPSPVPTPRPAPAPPTRTGGAPVLHQPLQTAQIADNYRKGLILYGQARYADARGVFQQVFSADPNGQLADNALFWIGETYYAAADYTNAMKYYNRVISEFGDQNKAPDAMFKMGVTFEKTGDLGMARRTFDDCIRKYPYSTAAASAKAELKRIKY